MIDTIHRRTRFDLHLHTSRSDGRFGPDEVLRRCANQGLDVVALTDHALGTVAAPWVHEIEGRRLHVIAGAELSGMHHGREYHLLVYFPHHVPQRFLEFCEAQCQRRAQRYQDAVRNLGLSGLPAADPTARAGGRALTRLHLARALVERGHASSVSNAFRRFLGHAHGTVPRLEFPMVDAIRLARACGGVTSWAHPSVHDAERHLATFVAAGLQGLEGPRPFLTSRDRSWFRRQARRHGLFLTGGSDWHGWHGDQVGLFHLETHQLTDFVDALLAA